MGDKISINTNLLLVGVVLILLVGGFILLNSQKNITINQTNTTQNTSQMQNTTHSSNQTNNQTTDTPIETNTIVISELTNGSMKLGPDNSTLVIVEFSDMQCPFCRKFWYQSLSKIKTEYIESGKVQFVFRHLPLDVHPMAQKSAEALLCAKEQNKEWEMHDKIYLEQIKIGALGTVRYGSYELLKWANETGLEMTSFQMCLGSGRYTDEVDFDKQYAKKLGFNATPSFIIAKRDGSNIVPIVGTQMYATYNATINELLK